VLTGAFALEYRVVIHTFSGLLKYWETSPLYAIHLEIDK
jgi:hypothetical protein